MSNIVLAAGSDEGYQISRSVRLRSSASANLSRTLSTPTSGTTWTWSGWVKLGSNVSASVQNTFFCGYPASGAYYRSRITTYINTPSDFGLEVVGASSFKVVSNALLRDPSAWYHLIIAFDSTQATASNRVKLYINGQQVTSLASATYPSQNAVCNINSSGLQHFIGADAYLNPSTPAYFYFDGYLTEVNFIDGQALTPASFGETDAVTGVWKPKKYTGTYGTNGFYLNFSDPSAATATTIGKDSSGNGNNWTPNNISVTAGATYDSMLDVPTLWADGGNGRGNYAVISPIDKASNIAVAQGNLNVTNSGGSTWASVRGSAAVSSGKWYWEIDQTYSSGGPLIMGIADAAFNVFTQRAGDTAGSYVLAIDGNKGNNGTFSAYAGGSIASGRSIGVALDLDTGTLVFYNNGVSLGTAYSGISGTFFPVVSVYGTQGGTANFNFGQRPFAYTPPTGFKALNTQNLPEPTIKKGNQYFDVSTYTGNGGTQSIVNSGAMQPDLVWVKSRSAATSNDLFDSVRGATLGLTSNATSAEGTWSGVTAFNSNGFTLGSNTSNNASGASYVGWQWKESVSAGFDIVTYTGNGAGGVNISHSLGVAPKMMIVKSRSLGTQEWAVYHAALGATKALYLNTKAAALTSSAYWWDVSPSSSVFTVGNGGVVNSNGATFVAYLFAEVAGFSKFGSYTGNGSADGPFVFCGFRPRYILWKEASGANAASASWQVLDTARNPSNVSNTMLYPNLSGAEGTGDNVDILSNGFKIRASGYFVNESGGTYIFAAFAENPFKNSLAR